MNEEIKNLKRCIKKKDRRIKYLENELLNKMIYINELEEIEDNRLILYLRNIKEEIRYFDTSCTLNNENLLEYHIRIKREYKEGSE